MRRHGSQRQKHIFLVKRERLSVIKFVGTVDKPSRFSTFQQEVRITLAVYE